MAHVKDTEEYVARRSKLGKKDPLESDAAAVKGKAKIKPGKPGAGNRDAEAV